MTHHTSPRRRLGKLGRALENSDLSGKVDLVDWHRTDDRLREGIRGDAVMAQQAEAAKLDAAIAANLRELGYGG